MTLDDPTSNFQYDLEMTLDDLPDNFVGMTLDQAILGMTLKWPWVNFLAILCMTLDDLPSNFQMTVTLSDDLDCDFGLA